MAVITAHYRTRVPRAQRNARQRPVYVLSMEQREALNARLFPREAIPGLSHSVKVPRICRVSLQLASKLHDVHVHGA